MNKQLYLGKVLGAALLFSIAGSSTILSPTITPVAHAQATTATTTYIVRSGDTLSTIASRYGVTTSALMVYNGLRTTTIYVNQRLAIPVQPDSQLTSTLRYIVQRGDTLSGLARRYGTTVAAIQQENKLRTTKLQVGQTLWIPTRQAPESRGDRPSPRPNTPTEQRIQFAPGASSATLFGTVDAGHKVRYHLRARQGQQMAVTIGPNSHFVVREPNGDPLSSWDGPEMNWQGSLPVNGEYTIEVMPINAGDHYQLTVAIQ